MLNILIKNSINILSKEQKRLKKARKGNPCDLGSIQNKIAKNKALLIKLFNHKSTKTKYWCNPHSPLDLRILFKGNKGLELKNAKTLILDSKPEPVIELEGCIYIKISKIIAINEEAEKLFQEEQVRIENSPEKKDFEEKQKLWHDTLRVYEPEYQKISNEFHRKIKELEEERKRIISELDQKYEIETKRNECYEAEQKYNKIKGK